MACVGMLLVVVGKVGGLDCDMLNDVIDEGVHDILLYIANHLLLCLIIMFGLAKITQLMRRSQ